MTSQTTTLDRNSLPLRKAHRQAGVRSLINYSVPQIEALVLAWNANGQRTPSVDMQWAYIESIKVAQRELALRSR